MPENRPPSATEIPGVRLEGVTKRFGSLTAVRAMTLEVEPGEFFSLLGPSGCGKSTMLRMIGGFERPDEGRVLIGETDVTRLPPQKRPTAMVFQNYALFPTMTVGENVAYGLRVRKLPRAAREERVRDALARVDLAGFEDQYVTQLSGGQQQRVALARALAVRPGVLLFDEPLSNLDVALREQTRRELKVLQARLGATSIYVTHDQQEALALSDRIAVMREGRIRQVGAPETLYREPETAFVAQFLGGSNIVTEARLAVELTGGEAPKAGFALAVRPEHLRPSAEGGAVVRIRSRQFLGPFVEWWVEAGGQPLRAWVDPGLEVTEPLRLRAVEYRWVRADDG
jgi:ABC-type Fe3+/spermidine/putrescine transport system ATPase subunit